MGKSSTVLTNRGGKLYKIYKSSFVWVQSNIGKFLSQTLATIHFLLCVRNRIFNETLLLILSMSHYECSFNKYFIYKVKRLSFCKFLRYRSVLYMYLKALL